MSADSPQSPRDVLEARITALLLGELSAEESAALQAEIAQSPELSALHAELMRTIGLVGEAASSLQEDSVAPVEGLKLSAGRRERLLESFKVLRPAALAPQRRFKWRELATLAAMLIMLLVLAGGIGLDVLLDPNRRSMVGLGESLDRSAAAAGQNNRDQGVGALAASDFGEVRNDALAADLGERWLAKRAIGKSEEMDVKQRASKPASPSQPAGEINGRVDAPPAFRRGGGGRQAAPLPESLMADADKRKELNSPLAGPGGPPPAPVAPPSQAVPESRLIAGSAADGDRRRFAVELGRTAGGLAGGVAIFPPSPTPLYAEVPQAHASRPATVDGLASGAVTLSAISDVSEVFEAPSLKQQSVALGLEDANIAGRKRPLIRTNGPTLAFGTTVKPEASRQSVMDLQSQPPAEPLPAVEAKLATLEYRGDESRSKLAQDKKDQKLAEAEQVPARSLSVAAPIPQPERSTAESAFSTFSLNVTDVSFKLAAASLEKGQMPDPSTVRSEEFINAFDYRDPEPSGSAPVAFTWERARDPFEHDRDLLRFSVKTAASGRQSGRPLNLVLLLDNSGSMERADRVQIRQECLRILAAQLQPQDHISVVAFARTARLWLDNLPGTQAAELPQRVGGLTPEGGTNLEEAMNLAYQTAQRHFLPDGVNRVVLLTDGAANLGDVEPESLKRKVESNRHQGIALDCFGIGWEGFNDELMEALARNGDGRYGFVNTPEAATTEFASQLVGALKVAASDVKVQVEWNPRRVTMYRQVGYAKHQLTQEQFRDNSVDAAELGAAEAGNAIYTVQVNPAGEGPLGTVRVRFKVPGTSDYQEHEWPLPYDGGARALDAASPALRLAVTASAFSEWLVGSPFAAEVVPDKLLGYLRGVPENWPSDPRPKKLEWMIRQAGGMAAK